MIRYFDLWLIIYVKLEKYRSIQKPFPTHYIYFDILYLLCSQLGILVHGED